MIPELNRNLPLDAFQCCYQVFEKLGPSLFDFLKRNKYCPFPVDLVREFGRQLLESVACVWIVFSFALRQTPISFPFSNQLSQFSLWLVFVGSGV